MASAIACNPSRELAQQWRAWGSALVVGAPAPHDDVMSLIWGPTFDRLAAMRMLARDPQATGATMQAVLEAADRFDALHAQWQRRLRRLLLRHRALSHADNARMDHAPHLVD